MPKAQFTHLAEKLAAAIDDGTLPPGTRLPTHRAFAEGQGVALATATRAYGELQKRGLIVGERGRGVFVRDTGVPTTLGIEQAASDGLIDLVFNMPGDATDAEMLRAGLKRLASAGDLEAMLRYQPHGGRPHERRIIAAHAGARLGQIDPDRLLITSGGQHGLAMAALGLLRRGDAVGTDPLTYPGFKAVAALQGLSLVPVDGRDGIIDIDALEHRCRRDGLRALYLMPTVQNPLGAVMDEATRHRLIEVARRHDLLLIEDSAYAFLETDPPASLVEIAPEKTVHVAGFSKSIATGLRVGYVVAPERYAERLTRVVRATTWNAPALVTALVVGWIEDGTLARCEDARRRDGAERQRLFRSILGDVPALSHRNAGFAWLPLAGRARVEPLVARLKAKGIAVSPSGAYDVTEAAPQAIRLAFGGVVKADLEQALETIRTELSSPAVRNLR